MEDLIGFRGDVIFTSVPSLKFRLEGKEGRREGCEKAKRSEAKRKKKKRKRLNGAGKT